MRERRSFLTPSSFDLYSLVRLQKYLWVFLSLKAKDVLWSVSFSGCTGDI